MRRLISEMMASHASACLLIGEAMPSIDVSVSLHLKPVHLEPALNSLPRLAYDFSELNNHQRNKAPDEVSLRPERLARPRSHASSSSAEKAENGVLVVNDAEIECDRKSGTRRLRRRQD